MEKIQFDEKTFIWKTKLGLSTIKELILNEALDIIEQNKNTHNFDAYSHKLPFQYETHSFEKPSLLDKILSVAVENSKSIINTNYNTIWCNSWINLIRKTNPIQPGFYDKNKIVYHNHVELATIFKPSFTFVYYIQMPDIVKNEDGVLYLKGDTLEHYIMPEEDDLLILPGDLPHAPNHALNSKLDRIVLAGNVGFEYVKNQKSIL